MFLPADSGSGLKVAYCSDWYSANPKDGSTDNCFCFADNPASAAYSGFSIRIVCSGYRLDSRQRSNGSFVSGCCGPGFE